MARFRIDKQMSAEEEDSGSIWAFIWTLFAFKIVTSIIIFWQMRTVLSGLVVGANTWYAFPIIAMLGAAPLMYRYRLRQQRARRAELLRSEWMVGPDDDDRAIAAMLREGESRR